MKFIRRPDLNVQTVKIPSTWSACLGVIEMPTCRFKYPFDLELSNYRKPLPKRLMPPI
jgi:hypothetical protein